MRIYIWNVQKTRGPPYHGMDQIFPKSIAVGGGGLATYGIFALSPINEVILNRTMSHPFLTF